MKKLWLLIVMTLTLSLCACSNDASSTATGNENTTSYTCGDVTFKIPTAWGEPTANEDSEDSDETYYFYPEGKKDDGIVSAMLMIGMLDQNIPENMTKEEIKTGFETYNSGLSSENIAIKSSKIIESFKYPCEYIKGTAIISGESYQFEAYVLFYKGNIYNIMLGTSDNNENDYSSDLKNIVNTIEYASEEDDDSTTEQADSEKPKEEVSQEFKNALAKAQTYSDMMYMSKKRIYEQLTSDAGEGFPEDAAKYAIKHVDADWEYNALKKAKSYYNDMAMSKDRVYEQLVSDAGEGFTEKQAQYAVNHLDD